MGRLSLVFDFLGLHVPFRPHPVSADDLPARDARDRNESTWTEYAICYQVGTLFPMRKGLQALMMAVLLAFPLGRLMAAASPADQQMKQLKKRHKVQKKEARQQQRAMEKVMAQHEQTSESRARFKHDMKLQRQMLDHAQKEETRRLKDKNKSDKRYHPSS